MKPWRAAVALVALTAVGLCTRDRLQRGHGIEDTAVALDVYTPAPPDDPTRAANDALARDARRRELRFFDAAKPGTAFAATRLAQQRLEAGRVSPADAYQIGAQLFHHRFVHSEGFGSKEAPGLRRVHLGPRGGPDAYRCADCHRRGGIAGAGDASDDALLDGDGDRPASALERNPPPLQGAGLVELVAREMSAELAAQRDALIAEAKKSGKPARRELSAKSVRFGELGATADGTLDLRALRGVDRDLIVKPFGWKGHAASLREIVEDELALHHGMQSSHLAATAPPAVRGSFPLPDPDGDGVVDEIGEGQVSALTLFVAMQEVPQVSMPERPEMVLAWSAGERRFDEIGCAGCHRPSLPLDSTVYELPSRDGGHTVRIDLAQHGADPRLQPSLEGGGYRVYLFSDLKRHVVGANLKEARSYRGVSQAEFLTRPLWGIARSRPYLHDARAPTLDDAILAHSGEASAARDAYAKLDEDRRASIRIYLTSLTRTPRVVSP